MKGFVGGIPIALLAAAAHAMEHGTVSTNRTIGGEQWQEQKY
jgi:hypothetical protein